MGRQLTVPKNTGNLVHSSAHILEMVDFRCQLGRAVRCPESWLSFILGASVRMFGDEINVYISGLE